MLNVIMCILILVAAVSYYIVTSSEMKLNKIRKETLALNDENMELQNHLDYLKSYSNVNQKMQSSNLVQKAEEALRAEGISKIFGLVFKDNDVANAFWEKQGYTLRTNLNYRNKSLNQTVPQGE